MRFYGNHKNLNVFSFVFIDTFMEILLKQNPIALAYKLFSAENPLFVCIHD
jgi:hypothetical protein